MRKVSLWGLAASMALLAASGCKSTTPTAPAAPASALNGSGTRSDMIAGSDPTSLNTKSPPPGPDLYVSTARVYEGTQNTEAAKAQYERALKIDPAYLPALLGYAHLLDTQKEFTDADKYYEKAAKKHPEVAAIYNDWGMSQQRRGRLDESARLLTKATQLQPNKALYRNNLAMVLVVMHRPEEAYRQLAAIETPAVAHFNLGALLHRAGDDQTAAFHFARASIEDPTWAQARQWADRLGGVGAAPVNNALAVSGNVHVPPPDPQPDPAAAPYRMAARAPIVDQANAPLPPTSALPPLPAPAPQPEIGGSTASAAGFNGATIVTPPMADALPAFAGVEPGPVTPTSGIAYPTQSGPPSPSSTKGAAEPVIEAMPPLPPNGLDLAPLPPVR